MLRRLAHGEGGRQKTVMVVVDHLQANGYHRWVALGRVEVGAEPGGVADHSHCHPAATAIAESSEAAAAGPEAVEVPQVSEEAGQKEAGPLAAVLCRQPLACE